MKAAEGTFPTRKSTTRNDNHARFVVRVEVFQEAFGNSLQGGLDVQGWMKPSRSVQTKKYNSVLVYSSLFRVMAFVSFSTKKSQKHGRTFDNFVFFRRAEPSPSGIRLHDIWWPSDPSEWVVIRKLYSKTTEKQPSASEQSTAALLNKPRAPAAFVQQLPTADPKVPADESDNLRTVPA